MEYLELNGICYVGDVAYRLMMFKMHTSINSHFWVSNSLVIDYNKALELIENNKIVSLNVVL